MRGVATYLLNIAAVISDIAMKPRRSSTNSLSIRSNHRDLGVAAAREPEQLLGSLGHPPGRDLKGVDIEERIAYKVEWVGNLFLLSQRALTPRQLGVPLKKVGVQLFLTFRTKTMTKLSVEMISNIGFDLIPIAFVIPNLFAASAHGEQVV